MKNSVIIIFLCLLLIFINYSCGIKDYTDFKDVKVKASPEMAVPLAYGKMNVSKLINSIQDEDSLFGKHPNGDVTIVYEEKNFFDYAVKDLITFDKNINLGNIDFEVGTIDIDFDFDYSITIGDILDNLEGDIQQLKESDGTAAKFPGYEYKSTPPTEFEVDNINDFEQVSFNSGKLVVELTNRLPVFGVFIEADLFDKQSGKSVAKLNFGDKDRYPGYDLYYSDDYFAGAKFGLPGSICTAGGSPGAATEQVEINLAGVKFSNQLVVKLNRLYTGGSGGVKPIIHFSDDLFFELTFVDAKVEAGRFKVPDQTIDEVTDKIENLDITDSIKLHKAGINAGMLEFKLSKTLAVAGTLHLAFPGITKADGSNLKIDMPFDEKTSFTYLTDLSNVNIDFSENSQNPFNTLFYTYSVNVNKSDIPINFSSTDNFKFVVNLKNLDVSSAEGDFGQKEIAIDPSTLSIFPESFDKVDGNLSFLNPTIKLIVHNAISAPVRVELNMDGANKKGQTAQLNPVPFILPFPDYPSQTEITGTYEFNKGNSNIIEFLALPPTQSISYDGIIKLNPDGPPAFNDLNYIKTNSKISLDLEVEVPVAFKSSEVNITDTIAFDGENLKNVISGELMIKADNGIPLGMDVELNFIDSVSGTVFGTPVKSILLDAANVDDAGVVTSHTIATHSVVLSDSQIVQYRKANAIQVKATIYSPEKGSKPARLNGANELNINVGLKAKIDLNF